MIAPAATAIPIPEASIIRIFVGINLFLHPFHYFSHFPSRLSYVYYPVLMQNWYISRQNRVSLILSKRLTSSSFENPVVSVCMANLFPCTHHFPYKIPCLHFITCEDTETDRSHKGYRSEMPPFLFVFTLRYPVL